MSECSDKNEEIMAKEVFSRFSLDAIATSAFGIEIDTFAEPNSVFKKMINEIQRTPDSEAGSKWEMFKFLATLFLPITKYVLYVEQFSSKAMGFLQNALLKTIEMRRNGSCKRNDIIDLVIEQIDSKQAHEKCIFDFYCFFGYNQFNFNICPSLSPKVSSHSREDNG